MREVLSWEAPVDCGLADDWRLNRAERPQTVELVPSRENKWAAVDGLMAGKRVS